MKQSLKYSLRVWLTAALLSPILYVLVESVAQPGSFRDWNSVSGFVALTAGYGLVLSIPCWLILFALTLLLYNRTFNESLKKLSLTVVGALLSLAPFYLLFGHDTDNRATDTILWALCYCAVIVVGIWFYKLGKATNADEALKV